MVRVSFVIKEWQGTWEQLEAAVLSIAEDNDCEISALELMGD